MEEEVEYVCSDDDEPIKQQRVGTEAIQRPQYQTPQFGKQIDKMTRGKLSDKQKIVRPDFLVPHTNLNTNMRNDPLLYVAPMIYVWDPPGQYWRTECIGSHSAALSFSPMSSPCPSGWSISLASSEVHTWPSPSIYNCRPSIFSNRFFGVSRDVLQWRTPIILSRNRKGCASSLGIRAHAPDHPCVLSHWNAPFRSWYLGYLQVATILVEAASITQVPKVFSTSQALGVVFPKTKAAKAKNHKQHKHNNNNNNDINLSIWS